MDYFSNFFENITFRDYFSFFGQTSKAPILKNVFHLHLFSSVFALLRPAKFILWISTAIATAADVQTHAHPHILSSHSQTFTSALNCRITLTADLVSPDWPFHNFQPHDNEFHVVLERRATDLEPLKLRKGRPGNWLARVREREKERMRAKRWVILSCSSSNSRKSSWFLFSLFPSLSLNIYPSPSYVRRRRRFTSSLYSF